MEPVLAQVSSRRPVARRSFAAHTRLAVQQPRPALTGGFQAAFIGAVAVAGAVLPPLLMRTPKRARRTRPQEPRPAGV